MAECITALKPAALPARTVCCRRIGSLAGCWDQVCCRRCPVSPMGGLGAGPPGILLPPRGFRQRGNRPFFLAGLRLAWDGGIIAFLACWVTASPRLRGANTAGAQFSSNIPSLAMVRLDDTAANTRISTQRCQCSVHGKAFGMQASEFGPLLVVALVPIPLLAMWSATPWAGLARNAAQALDAARGIGMTRAAVWRVDCPSPCP